MLSLQKQITAQKFLINYYFKVQCVRIISKKKRIKNSKKWKRTTFRTTCHIKTNT